MTTLSLRDLGFVGGLGGYDTDALTYITAVEAADGQSLEVATKDAINAFVVSCKLDGIWSAIKASCIMAGARTLAGALVPLVGTAPTNFNFVSGDYNRKTGLKGDGTTKYLNANRNNNVDPQNSAHISTYSTEHPTSVGGQFPVYIGSSGGNGERNIYRFQANGGIYSTINGPATNTGLSDLGFLGAGRNAATIGLFRANATTFSYGGVSVTPLSLDMGVFAAPGGNLSITRSNARLAFYSIGESLDLALLDSRVTALITAIGAAF
jgi:hypothetical protein